MRIILVIVALFLLVSPVQAADKESVYDRIMRTGVIRCGYWVSPPLLIRDPNTGVISGAYGEYIEALGKALGLKIEWTGEMNLGTYLQDLNQGKFDAECGTGWPNALRGKQVEYTNPVGFMPMYIYTKAGNTQFDDRLELIDKPDVRYVGHDGGTNSQMQMKRFPNSTLISIPGDASYTEPLDMIRYGKADVTLASPFEGNAYSEANPNTVHLVKSEPLRIIPIVMSIPANEFRLVSMLNTATNELLYDGTIDALYKKYNISNDVVLRVSEPYK